MRWIGLIYMIWPAILWIVWGGMAHFGHEGWGMDLLFIAAVALTAIMGCVAVFIAAFMSKM